MNQFINSYFQKIVDEVTNHGGDVLKFAGDAVFAEWRVSTKPMKSKDDRYEANECVLRAATCGADIVAKCSDYPIIGTANDDGVQIATLNVHCGLAFGKMAGIHVGNDYNRREFMVIGESIEQVTKACAAATYGELLASPEAYDVMNDCTIQRGIFGKRSKKIQPVLIASKEQYFFEKKSNNKKERRYSGYMRRRPPTEKKKFKIPFDSMDITCMKYLQKLLSFYAHPVVVSDEANRPTNTPGDLKSTQERHRSEAELRSVYTLFIKPLIETELTDDSQKNNETFTVLNHIFHLVTSVLDGFKGHLRQFIIDDKGKGN